MIGVILLLYRFRDVFKNWRQEENFRYVLGFALILTDMSYYWRLSCMPWLSRGVTSELPVGLCTWAVIFCGFMVVGKKQTLFDIAYFWLLSGTVFALLTPTPLTLIGPTRFRYYQFWLEHTLGYIAVFYMIFVHKMRPTVRSALKAYVALILLAVTAYGLNRLLPGANYLYMARPEAAPSVLDILPPNFALRLSIMVAVITLLFALAYLPWYLRDRRQRKREDASGEIA